MAGGPRGFNYDFHVSSDEAITPIEYNYKDSETLEREGLAWYVAGNSDQHGVSVFARDGGSSGRRSPIMA